LKYYLNLVLVDEDDRRYFKQQEITLWRKRYGGADKTRNISRASERFEGSRNTATEDA